MASNPADAHQTVTIAMDERGAYIAAKLGASSRSGLWLGVGFEAPALPMPGKYVGNAGYVPRGTPVPGGCAESFKATDDGEGIVVEGHSPSLVAACKAEVARHVERVATYNKRFKRLYRLDARGVHLVSEGGEMAPVPGAQIAFGAHGGETALEAFVPASALPRIGEAPIKTVKLVARSGSTVAPALDAWVWSSLPRAVSPEVQGPLLAHAFARAHDHGPAGPDGIGSPTYRLPRALSYRLSDPAHVEVVDSTDCASLATRELPVYEKAATWGDLEIGYVASPRGNSCAAENEHWLAIFVRSKLVAIKETGAFRGAVVRGGELHVLTYSDASWAPVWSAVAIAPNGAQREAVEPATGLVELVGKSPYWSERVEIPGRAFDGFGFRGMVEERRIEVVWRWDDAKRVYRGKPKVVRETKQKTR